MSWIVDPFSFDFFGRALVAGSIVGAMCGAIGVFVLLRHLAYIGHGLSYGMLAGVAGATVAGINPYLGALAATAAGALLIDRVRRLAGIGGDAAIGIVSTTLFAVGVAVISADRSRDFSLEGLLFGNVLGVQPIDIALVAVVGVATVVVLVAAWKTLTFTTFDPDVAATHGVRTVAIEILFSLLIGAIVVVSLRVVGVLLITAVLVLPAAVARLAVNSLTVMVPFAAVVGVVCNVVGLYASYYTDVASGPAIVLAGAVAFAVVVALGSLGRRRRMAEHRRSASESRNVRETLPPVGQEDAAP